MKKPEGEMSHTQNLAIDRKLSDKELQEAGVKLAKEELTLDQVRKEKKDTVGEFDAQIKEHVKEISRLSVAIDTGVITDQLECEVYLDRNAGKKLCFPKDGGKQFQIPMTENDFDLLT